MVERLYPGVYVTEVPFQVKSIEGVSTSTAGINTAHTAADEARLPIAPAPDWTQHNHSDPGVTFLQLFSWLNESTLFRAHPSPDGHVAKPAAGSGVVQGLAVEGHDPQAGGDLRVSAGLALSPHGRPVETEQPTPVAHRVKKP